MKEMLSDYHAILVPGGFGDRGVLGKMLAIQYARENNVPFLGYVLACNLPALSFARNALNISDATSEEFDVQAKIKSFI